MAQKHLLDNVSQEIVALIQKNSNGTKLGQLVHALSSDVSKRTIQRKLLILKTQKIIYSRGEKSGTRYFYVATNSLLPLSTKAKAIKKSINQPIQQRKPVGYIVIAIQDAKLSLQFIADL